MKRYRLGYQAEDTPMKRTLTPTSFHRRISCSPALAPPPLSHAPACATASTATTSPPPDATSSPAMVKLNWTTPPCRTRCSHRRASRTPCRRGMRRPPCPHRRKLHHLLLRRLHTPTRPPSVLRVLTDGADGALVVSSPTRDVSPRQIGFLVQSWSG
jgi:hypothetical protein